MQNILSNKHYEYSGSAMPSAVIISILLLHVGMIAIMMFGTSAVRIRFLEDKEEAQAAFYALELKIMADTTLALDTTFMKYAPFQHSDKTVEAKITMKGLYGILAMRSKISSGPVETKTVLIGTKDIPYSKALVVPSSDAGYVSLGKECRFEQPLMLPLGAYRTLQHGHSIHPFTDFHVYPAPNTLPELSSAALESIRKIYMRCDESESIVLDSKDTIPDKVVTAKVIKVDPSFSNSVQLFATDSIIVSSGAVLKHPSGIFVNSSKGHIRIDSCAIVEGYCIVKNLNDDQTVVPVRHLSYHQEHSSKIRGLVYVDGTAQLKGHVSGSVYVKTPVEHTEKGVSQMTILQLTQTKNNIYAYPLLFEDRLSRQIIKNYETDY